MRIHLILFFSLLSFRVSAQTFDWVEKLDYRPYTYLTNQNWAVDSEGNIYTALAEDKPYTAVNFYLQKRNSEGTILWTKNWESEENQNLVATVTLDDDNNIIVSGSFKDTIDFDPGPGVFELYPSGVNSNVDMFVVKLNADGEFIWAIATAGSDDYHQWARGRSVQVDSENNIFIAGTFEGTIDFDPGPDLATLYCPSGILIHSQDGFVLKLTPGGEYIWVKHLIYGGDNFLVHDMDISGSDELHITGCFDTSVDFDPGPDHYYMTPDGESRDLFILKLSNDGEFIWADHYGDYAAEGKSIATTQSGEVVITGFVLGETDFDPSDEELLIGAYLHYNGYILKLTIDGEYMWAKPIAGGDVKSNAIALDEFDNSYITGKFSDEIDIDPGEAEIHYSSLGVDDAFIIKLDSSSNFVWGTTLGSAANENGRCIVSTEPGKIIVTGRFFDTLDFDPGLDTVEIAPTGSDSSCYLLQLEQCEPLISYDTISSCDPYTWVNDVTYTSNREIGLIKQLEESCDSIYYLNYTRLPSYDTTYSPSSCTAYEWIDGIFYDHDTIVSIVYENIHGCDSTLFLDFDYIEPDIYAESLVTCEPYVWLDGETYYEDTLLTFTYTSDDGCDSVRTMDLEFPYIPYSISASDCYSYTWIDGITYYTDTLVIDTLDNPFGCDTIAVLNLNIEDEITTILSEVSTCFSYAWVDGVTYTNDTLVSTLISDPFDCDTLKTLDLEITTVNTEISLVIDQFTAEEEDASYSWINCADFSIIPGENEQTFSPDEFGTYAVIIEKDGCIDTSECLLFFIDDASIATNLMDKISLYPNPGTSEFNLTLPPNQNLEIEIFDLEGRQVAYVNSVNQEKLTFDLAAEAGVYLILITSETDTRSLKLIKL